MPVLLDENLPIELAAEFSGHEVDTVVGIGWSGLTNGELLGRAAGTYDAFVTMDRNLEHQQAISRLPFAVILIVAPSNRRRDLRPVVHRLQDALKATRPSAFIRVGR